MLGSSKSKLPIITIAEAMPSLSRLAWEKVIARLGINEPETDWHDEALLGASQVLVLPNDDWAMDYENTQEKLAKQQRKKGQPQTGVFYTPAPVAAYLTQRSLGDFLSRASCNMARLIQADKFDEAFGIFQQVRQLKIVDPACGTGVFLVEALKLLARFYRESCEKFPQFNLAFPAQYAASQQLYGIELDPVSTMVCRLRLAQWVHWLDGQIIPENLSLDEMELDFKTAIVCDDTLKAHVFDAVEGWDFILGNPPYVSEVRGQSQRFKGLKDQNPDYYQPKMDLCDAFLAWAIRHVKPTGQLVYVLPEYWTQRSSSAPVRADLWAKGLIREFWSLQDSCLFPNAPGHHSSFLIWQKEESITSNLRSQQVALGVCGFGEKQLESEQLQELVFALDTASGKLLYGNALEMALLEQLAHLPPLLQKNEIQQGIVIPQGRLKPSDRQRLVAPLQEGLPQDAGVFLLNTAEVQRLNLTETELQCLKPYYLPAGFQPFVGFKNRPPDYQIIYGDLQTRTAMAQQPSQYSKLCAHLAQFQAINTSDFAPYGLHRSRQAIWFEDEHKILCPRQVLLPVFSVVGILAYVSEGFYSIRSANLDVHFVCAILNSKLAWFWFYKQKRKGHRLQIDKDVLTVFPAPPLVTLAQRDALTKLARLLAEGETHAEGQRANWLDELNQKVFQLYGVTPEQAAFIDQLQGAILQRQ